MKKTSQSLYTTLLLVLALVLSLSLQAQTKIKVACVGNSITYGAGIKKEEKKYPDVLQDLMGEKFEVKNFGLSGRTLLKNGDKPYWKEKRFQEVQEWMPDIVIIKLGTNDSKPQNWRYKEEFVDDYSAFIKVFRDLGSKPKVYVCTPIAVTKPLGGITDSVVKSEVVPAVKKIAKKNDAILINLYPVFEGRSDILPDGVHPNAEGAKLLAEQVYKVVKSYKIPKSKR